MMKTLTNSVAIAAVAFFAGSVFAGKGTPPKLPDPCKYVVLDGYFNKLFMQNGSSRSSMPVYQEVEVDTGNWGPKHIVMASTGYMLLYDTWSLTQYGTSWTMQFKDQHKLAGVCYFDNWNRVYQGWTVPYAPFNDAHFAILSGTEAATKCLPFPGTIDGEKIPVTSPVVYGVGDCAQAVSMQYPNATGVQVDPWGGPWTTNCYAVFGDKKTDEPNNNAVNRACFFKDTIRPGGLHGGVSLGTGYDNLEACVIAAKADVRAQKAQAAGITYDRATEECWYHNSSETAYYNREVHMHVIFAKPLAPSKPKMDTCYHKCPEAAAG